MRPVRVKMCGLVRSEDVREAVRLGADYLGFVFAESPRRLSAAQAERLLGDLDTGKAVRVGVFKDAPARFVNEMVLRCGLGLVQLHGTEPRDFPGALCVPVLRAVRVPAAAVARAGEEAPVPLSSLPPNVEAVLLDAVGAAGETGGRGLVPDPTALARSFARLPAGTRVFLAGGLAPETVAAAVRLWKPWGVDVSSGIESAPGIKDARRMAAFLAALEDA